MSYNVIVNSNIVPPPAPTKKPRIAIVTPMYFNVFDVGFSTINIETFVHGFKKLGYEASLICPEGSRCNEDVPHRIENLADYSKPEFWRTVDAEILIFFNWLKNPAIVRAMKAAGKYVISRADSSGAQSIHYAPDFWYQYMVASEADPVKRMKLFLHFLRCYLFLYRSQDAPVLESIAACDHIAIETHMARTNLLHFLSSYRQTDKLDKIVVCPHLIAEDILTAPLVSKKRDKIVAIGRWDAPQKDAPLLQEALLYLLQQSPTTEVVLIGKAGEKVFGKLLSASSTVRCTGLIPREEIKDHIGDASILALSSRWETFHIAAHEALCLGATVVGPSVIPLPDIVGAGDYGQMARTRSSRELGEALFKEHSLWQSGKRDLHQIARFWRERLNTQKVLQEMIEPALKTLSVK